MNSKEMKVVIDKLKKAEETMNQPDFKYSADWARKKVKEKFDYLYHHGYNSQSKPMYVFFKISLLPVLYWPELTGLTSKSRLMK
jgi:hypothetical protein